MTDLEPVHAAKFPFRTQAQTSLWESQVEWCDENFGPYMEGWDYTGTRFYFKTESDLLLFMLRWGSK